MYEAVDNIGIAVTDLDMALEFYETLGFQCEPYSEMDARVDPSDSSETYFYVFETNSDDSLDRDANFDTNPPGHDHVSIRVADVDATVESLEDDAVEFFLEPTTDTEWGLRMAGTRDPSGNIFYLVEYVSEATES
jgi:catechol 2,3-dioxygenase-like lactoylglutathione lyase family enzyme